MLIKRIRLNGFRSYEELIMEPTDGLNVIVGPNAAGKTNILEAVFFSALGRSHRTSRDAELINRKFHGSYIGIELKSQVGHRTIEIKLKENEHKAIKVDGRKLTRMGELMGVLNTVMFSPEDLSIVKSSPQERRRFMDMELCQLRPTYFYRLQQYNVALKQRSGLMKDAFSHMPDEILLDSWNEKLAKLGGDVMSARSAFVEKLGDIASELHGRITDDNEQLHVYYKPNVAFDEMPSEKLYSALKSSRDDDIRRGFTTRGPHRDDIGIKLNGDEVKSFCSQGQQRTAALSLKLSELALMRNEKGEYPVLLLDDVLSELDTDRQRALLSNAFNCQCFLTTTSIDGLEDLPNMSAYECYDGKLTRII